MLCPGGVLAKQPGQNMSCDYGGGCWHLALLFDLEELTWEVCKDLHVCVLNRTVCYTTEIKHKTYDVFTFGSRHIVFVFCILGLWDNEISHY